MRDSVAVQAFASPVIDAGTTAKISISTALSKRLVNLSLTMSPTVSAARPTVISFFQQMVDLKPDQNLSRTHDEISI
jgi:hypothetical protein